MWFFNGRGPFGFSASSTAEVVTHGIDGTGLTAIITGASTGIGAETARALSLGGVHVIMAVGLSNFFFHSRVVFSCDCLMSDLDMKVSIDNTTCADYTLVKVEDPKRLSSIEEQLNNILGGPANDGKVAHTKISMGLTHIGRRLHQMMFADRDYEVKSELVDCDAPSFQPVITVEHCEDKGYSVVNVQCKDRSNLLFDIVCTLTDMEYVVFHASISSDGPYAHQEYYIRHMDGSPVNTEGEKAKVIKCLEAAIRRRVCEGLSLELCARDKVGLLSEVTRILRENGLSVSRADVTTVGERAKNVFYVRDASGNPVDMNTIEGLRKEIGQTMMLNVKKVPNNSKAPESKKWAKTSFFFGGLLEKFLT